MATNTDAKYHQEQLHRHCRVCARVFKTESSNTPVRTTLISCESLEFMSSMISRIFILNIFVKHVERKL